MSISWDTLPPSGHKGNCQDLEAQSKLCLGVLGPPNAWQILINVLNQITPRAQKPQDDGRSSAQGDLGLCQNRQKKWVFWNLHQCYSKNAFLPPFFLSSFLPSFPPSLPYLLCDGYGARHMESKATSGCSQPKGDRGFKPTITIQCGNSTLEWEESVQGTVGHQGRGSWDRCWQLGNCYFHVGLVY